jgi:hypothetical protein
LENVVIKFIADTDGLKPAIDQLKLLGKITEEDAKAIAEINAEQKEFLNTINRTTTEAGKLNAEIEDLGKTMSNDVIGKAADELNNFTKESNQAVQGAKSLKAELRELKKQIASGDFTGEELRQMTKRAAELEDHLGDVNDRIKALASDTKYIDAMAGAMKGVAAAASVAAGASALFGSESEDLARATQKAQAAMALLNGVQELSVLITSENAAKTIFLDSAQKLAAVSSRALGITISTSMAAATMGVSLIIGALVALTAGMDDTEEEAKKIEEAAAERYKASYDLISKIEENRLKLITDNRAKELALSKFNYEQEKKRLNESGAEEDVIQNAIIVAHKLYRQEREAINKKYDDQEKEQAKKKKDDQIKALREAKERAEKEWAEEQKRRKEKYGELTAMESISIKSQKINGDKALQDKLKRNEQEIKDNKQKNDQILLNNQQAADRQAELDKAEAARKREIKQAEIEGAQILSNTIFEITNRDINARYEAEIAAIEKRTTTLLDNENLTAAQRKKIEDKAQRDIAKIKTEQFKRQKAADIIQATINTALAVSRALSTGGIPAAILAGFAGAAQVAVIASQPIPQFAKGTEKFISEGTGTQDKGLAWLSHGERVVPTSVNNDYFEALSAIQNRAVDPTLANNIMTALSNGTFAAGQGDKMDVNKLVQALKGTNKQTTVNINIDEQGFMKFVQKGNSHREYLNKKFRYEA